MLKIALLGRFELLLHGQPVEMTSRPLQKLAAYLALNVGKSIPRAKLAGILWLDSPESTARKNLRHYLWRLRQAIGDDYLMASRHAAGFKPAAAYQIDVAQLANAPDDGDLETLIAAVSAYQGELLPGYYDDWVQLERDRLQALFERRMQHLLDGLTAAARWLDLLTWSEHWVAHGQTPEPAYRSLMTGSAALGDQAGVALNYWRCKKALKESLGVEPSAETSALYERLTGQQRPPDTGPLDGRLDRSSFPGPPAPGAGTGPGATTGLELALADLSQGDTAASDRLLSAILEAQATGQTLDMDRLVQLINQLLSAKPAHLPAFLAEQAPEPPRPLFVGRETQIDRLIAMLEAVQLGQGQAAFIVGDAGSGKTSLMSAFAARVGELLPEALVAWGACNPVDGQGDPYLPFRRLLNMLAGELEYGWSAATITTGQARRIWEGMPGFVETLLDVAPDLLDTFVPGSPLLRRLESAFPDGHPLLTRLEKTLSARPPAGQLERGQLFEQTVGLIRRLSLRQPVVLILDDLQWADGGTTDFLFHLGRSLAGARILLLAAYRPDEVAARPDHPLYPLLAELRRTFGDAWLDLDRRQARDFVDAIVDSEANRLGEEFRDALVRATAGHPLFTVELLRDMQQRNDLVQDEAGRWTAAPSLDWRQLPTRIEGAIEARLGWLDDDLLDILRAAAVEGETFTAQVAAQVAEKTERSALRDLAQELQKRFRLVREDGSERAGQRLVSRYRFAHQMFQTYIYNQLSEAERQHLHGRVGESLEALHGPAAGELAPRLAWHFDLAGQRSKAATYALLAGDRARSLFADEEAAGNYLSAVKHLQLLGDDERLARAWLRLGLIYHNAFDYRRSRQAYDRAFRYWAKVKPPPEEQLDGATLRVWEMEPETLDPTGRLDADTATWLMQLYSGLVKLSAEKVIVPDVAQSWEIRDGGKTYVFHLRDDARWSDGQPVTAHDFILAWKRMLDPKAHDDVAEYFFDIKGARSFHQGQMDENEPLGLRAPDDLTLVFELDQPTSYFLHMLSASGAYPVPGHVIEGYGRQWAQPGHIVTNGPFKVVDWSPETGVLLDRNPYHHGLVLGNVRQVKVSLLNPEAGWESGMEQYMAGQIDILKTILFPRETVRAAQRRYGEFYTKLLLWPIIFYIAFDGQQPSLRDVRVRRALALAIDQERLVADLQKDDASPALGGFVPPGIPGHAPDIGLPYDPEGARRLLAEAGYPDGRGLPALEIVWYDLPSLKETAEYISQLWSDVLGATIRPVFLAIADVNALFEKGTLPAIRGGGWVAAYHDPDYFLRLGLWEYIQDHRPVQERLAAARTMTEQQGRLAVYREVDRMLIEDAICIPLYYGEYSAFFSPRVRKIAPDFRWSDFIVDPD